MSAPVLLDQPPDTPSVTDYDLAHRITYLRLLDAAAEGADWREAARLVLGLDPAREPERARRIPQSHLAGPLDDRAGLPRPAAARIAALTVALRSRQRAMLGGGLPQPRTAANL
jgi:hypothetical protein